MRNVYRRSVAAALTAATFALPVAAATPAAAQGYNCEIIIRDLTALYQDVSDCVNYILTSITIIDPDLPPHV